MFCPKCGTSEQSPESYCRNCGVWLVDPDAVSKTGLSRKSTREQKIIQIRIFEAISIGLSILSAAIIYSYLFFGLNRGLLFLAAICCILVGIYQAINMYLGYKLTKELPRQRPSEPVETQTPILEFPKITARQLNVPASVVEDTTDLLDPVARNAKHTTDGL